MRTRLLSVSRPETFYIASEALKKGEIVAFPTETVYGLGADARNEKAVEKIFQAKGRPSDNPIIIHVANKEAIFPLVKNIGETAHLLMNEFMPGPITLIMEKADGISDIITAGLSTVGIRMPLHFAAKTLLEKCGIPVAAPSANISGKPSSTCAAHVYKDFNGKIPWIIDGDSSEIGLESTVVDVTGDFPVILRPGVITHQMLWDCLSSRGIYPEKTADVSGFSEKGTPKAPGMKYRHYAPSIPVRIVLPENGDRVLPFLRIMRSDVGHIGIFCSSSEREKIMSEPSLENQKITFFTSGETVRERMKKLFAGLRYLDDEKVNVILAAGYVPEEKTLEESYMNRLEKAAAEKK